MVAVVGPYTSLLECDAQLPAVAQRAWTSLWRRTSAASGPAACSFRMSSSSTQLVIAKWEEPVDASFGPMVQLHVLLEFDHKVKEHLKAQRDQLIVTRRLGVLGTGVAAALLVLLIAYVVLKLDLVSGGQRRGRLAVVAVLALIAVVAVAAFLIEALDEVRKHTDATFDRPPTAPVVVTTEMHTVDAAAVAHPGHSLTPAEAMAPTWARLTVLAAVLSTVGLIAVGAMLTASGRRSGKVVVMLGGFLVAVIIAVLVLSS